MKIYFTDKVKGKELGPNGRSNLDEALAIFRDLSQDGDSVLGI